MSLSLGGRVRAYLSVEELWPSSAQWREMGWVASGQIAVLVLSVVSIRLMTSIGPDEYGKFVLASSIGAVLSLAFFGPLEQGYIRFYFVHGTEARSRSIFCRSLVSVLGASTAVLVLLGGIAVVALHGALGLPAVFTLSAAAMVIASVIGIPLGGMLNAMRLRRQVALIQASERVILILLLLVLTRHFPAQATGVMLSVALASLASCAVRLRVYSGTLGPAGSSREAHEQEADRRKRKDILRDVTAYSMPFLLWGGISWLQSNGERWVINGWMTYADVGRYGLAWSVVNSSAGLGAAILGQFVTPIIFRHFTAGDEGSVRRGEAIIRLFCLSTFALFGGTAIVLLLVGDPLITLLSNRSFTSGGPMLFALALGLGMFHVAQALTSLGLALNRPRIYLNLKIVAAISAILLYAVGCRLAGVFGVACAVVLANVLYLSMVYHANRKLRKSIEESTGA